MNNFFNRVGKVIHWIAFIAGVVIFIPTAIWGYGFIVAIIYFFVLNGSGFIINYIISGHNKFFPWTNYPYH